CRSLRKRLNAMGEAQKMDPLTKEGLVKIGVKEAIADGIVQAMNHYGRVDLSRYTAMLAEGLRYLLPEYREPIAPGEPVVEAAAPAKEEPPREPDESHDKATGPADRAEGEVQEDRQSGGPDGPSLGDEQRLEYVDADEASEGSTDEPQRAEEPAPTRQHAHAEQGERQVEVDQLGLGQEEDRDARQEGQREGSEDRDREAREGISNGRHGSLETGMR